MQIERDFSNLNIQPYINSRHKKLSLILNKMECFIKDTRLAFNQKRLHRESKAFISLDKLFEESTAFFIDEQSDRKATDDFDNLIVPSDIEFQEILTYIENELDELSIQDGYSSTSSADFNSTNREKSKVDSFKKKIISKENLKNNFYDIEFKIKLELKNIELKEKARLESKCSSIEQTKRLSCFTSNTKPTTSNKFEAELIGSSGKRMNIDSIKSFFIDEEILGKKRNSCFYSTSLNTSNIVKNRFNMKTTTEKDYKEDDISDYEEERKDQVYEMKISKLNEGKDKHQRRHSAITSSLFQ